MKWWYFQENGWNWRSFRLNKIRQRKINTTLVLSYVKPKFKYLCKYIYIYTHTQMKVERGLWEERCLKGGMSVEQEGTIYSTKGGRRIQEDGVESKSEESSG